MSAPVSSRSHLRLLAKASARHRADAVFAATRADGNERMSQTAVPRVKKRIGFLSFGHWHPSSRVGDEHGRRRPRAVDRARGRRRGARHRRRLLSRAPLRPAARLAVPAARGDRRAHEPHRDRHGRHRHALREPALHGRGGRRRRPHQRALRRRGPTAARREPRITRAGAERLAHVRLRAARGRDRCRPRARQDRAVPSRDRRARAWRPPTRR